MIDEPQLEQLFGARTATIVEDAIAAGDAAAIRSELERRGFARYRLVDRGSYDYLDLDVESLAASGSIGGSIDRVRSVVDEIAKIASHLTKRSLAARSVRALRLRAGDYLLAHHDTTYEGHPIEAALDLSPRATFAELHYRRRGQVFFRVPCAPLSLSLVERGPTVTSNHTYISRLHADAEVVRLVILLREEAR